MSRKRDRVRSGHHTRPAESIQARIERLTALGVSATCPCGTSAKLVNPQSAGELPRLAPLWLCSGCGRCEYAVGEHGEPAGDFADVETVAERARLVRDRNNALAHSADLTAAERVEVFAIAPRGAVGRMDFAGARATRAALRAFVAAREPQVRPEPPKDLPAGPAPGSPAWGRDVTGNSGSAGGVSTFGTALGGSGISERVPGDNGRGTVLRKRVS